MNFIKTKLEGAYIIEPNRFEDERGFFSEMYREDLFESHGLKSHLVQSNISFSLTKGTVRGMHFQVAPHPQEKLVRCNAGSIHDVIVDLRPESETYCEWISVELTSINKTMLYIPAGFAHGFQTLGNNAEVAYQQFELYHPECEGGVRWNDPAFGIDWPLEVSVISDRDRDYSDYKPKAKLG